jgi:hypothetical protein
MKRSEMLSAARCMMSEPAELGRPRVEKETRPENIEGFEMPVAKRRALYWLSLGDARR